MGVAVVCVVDMVAMLGAGVAAARAVHMLVLGVHRILVHACPGAVSVPVP
jgi:hypothetical protein